MGNNSHAANAEIQGGQRRNVSYAAGIKPASERNGMTIKSKIKRWIARKLNRGVGHMTFKNGEAIIIDSYGEHDIDKWIKDHPKGLIY